MSSKKEIFQLISLDALCHEIDTYKGQFTLVNDAEIISLLHRLLPWLKNNIQFQSTQTSAKEMQFKVLALMNGIVGYIAQETEKKKESSLRFVYGESDEGQVKLLNTGDASWEDLEGSNPEIMLPVQLFILVRFYFNIHYCGPEDILIANTSVLKEVFLESLLNEIFIVVNSAHIFYKYKSIFKANPAAVDVKNNMTNFIDNLIRSLKDIFTTTNFNIEEICFPCGFEGHFMYLTMLKSASDKLVFRYDNLGPGCEKHHINQTDKKPIPYTLFEININELDSTKEFFMMLCEQKFVNNSKEAIDKIYGDTKLKMSVQNIMEWDKGYKGIDKQMCGNCVFVSLIIGMRYRWESYYNTPGDAAFLCLMDNISVNTILSDNLTALAQGVNHIDHIKNMRNERLRQKQMKYKSKRFSSEPYENDQHVPMISANPLPINNHLNNISVNSRDKDFDKKYVLDLEIKFLFEQQRDILDFFTPPQFKYNDIVNDLSTCFNKNEGDKNKEGNRFQIIGETGCGKTILSKFIAHIWINKRPVANYEWVLKYDLVVRIPLREVSHYLLRNNMDVEDLLKIVCFAQLERELILAKTYGKKVLLLLDGLDEVFSILRKNTSVIDKSLLHKLVFNPKYTVLIFSRPVTIQYNPIDQLSIITIQKFNYLDIVKYVKNFFSLSDINPKLVIESIYRNISLRTLIRNPLLLEVFCSLLKMRLIIIDNNFFTKQFESSILYRIALEIKLKTNNTEEFCFYLLSELAWYLKDNKTGVILNDIFINIYDRLNFQGKDNALTFLKDIGIITLFNENRVDHGFVYLERAFQDYLSALYWSRLYENDRIAANLKYQDKNFEKMFFMIWKHSVTLLDDKNASDFINVLIDDAKIDNSLAILSISTVRLIYATSELNLKKIESGIFDYVCYAIYSRLKLLYDSKCDKEMVAEAFAQCPIIAIELIERSYKPLKDESLIEQFWCMVNYFSIKSISDVLVETIENETKLQHPSLNFLIYLSKSHISVLSKKNQIVILDLLVKCFNARLCVDIASNLSDNFLLGMDYVAFRILLNTLFSHLKYNSQPHFYALLKVLLKYAYVYEDHKIFCFFCEFFNEINDIETAFMITSDILTDLMNENYLITFIENYLSNSVDEISIDFRGFCKLIPFLEAHDNGIKILNDGKLITKKNENIKQPLSPEFKNNMLEAKYHDIIYSIQTLSYQDDNTACDLTLYYKANDPFELYIKITCDKDKVEGHRPQDLGEIVDMIFEMLKYFWTSQNHNLNFAKTEDNQVKIKLDNRSEVKRLVNDVHNNIQAWFLSWIRMHKSKCILM